MTSTINVTNLVVELRKKFNFESNEENILYYSKAIQQLRTGKIFVVKQPSDLPTPDTILGSLYFVDENETVYLATILGWSEIYKNSVRALFLWGRNICGQLGDGTLNNNPFSVREICSATNWCQASAGNLHTAAIKTTGELWAWGGNNCGVLGDGTVTNSCSPVREICSATNWCQVSANQYSTAAIKTIGELWTWGSNCCGQLGDGTRTNRCSPVREISSSTDWCQVGVGREHMAAVKTTGQVWTWGTNFGTFGCGRLGDGISTTSRCSPVREFCSATDWCAVSASNYSTAAIKTTGQIWAWGGNSFGDLAIGTTVAVCSPVREICLATDWCAITRASAGFVAIKTSGELWAWGVGTSGRIGDGTTTNRCSPVREIGSATNWCAVSASNHTAAIKTTGELWAWGLNTCGAIGNGNNIDICSPVREFSSATDWCSVSAGGLTAAIRFRTL